MMILSYFEQLKYETKAIFIDLKTLFYDNYSNPVMWIMILIVVVVVVMGTFNSLSKNN